MAAALRSEEVPVGHDAFEGLEVTWAVVEPTSSLWHGTTVAAVEGIAEAGIQPGGRTHVHLAPSMSSRVGKRALVEILLEISPRILADDGVTIFEAPNGVILVRQVPTASIVAARSGTNDAKVDLAAIERRIGIQRGPRER